MRILSVSPSIRLSVCSSVCHLDCDKTEERSVQICIPYKRSFILVFLYEWLVGGNHFYEGRPINKLQNGIILLPEILGQVAHVGEKLPILNRYSLVAPQQ